MSAGEGEGCWTEGCGGCFGRQRNPSRAISIYTMVRVALHYSYIALGKRGTVGEQKGSITNRLVVGKNLLAMSWKFRIFANYLRYGSGRGTGRNKYTENHWRFTEK